MNLMPVADIHTLAVRPSAQSPVRLALLCDYPEEGWPSMDLCAEMLLQHLQERHAGNVDPVRVCCVFRRRASRLPGLRRRAGAWNADRLLNRLWDYPRFARRLAGDFDLFHICDHSYSQLVHALPAERVGVFCHDLDTFRCLLEPARDPRPRWFRSMARHILRGLQKAAIVFHTTLQVRREIERHGLLDVARLVQVPLGVAPEFRSWAREPATEAGRHTDASFLLHVGSCVPRKRMDILLDVFALARSCVPGLRLVKVGSPWTSAQRAQIERLGVGPSLVQLGNLSRGELAALYRAAALVLLPSDAEGFGLPVIEALACGSIVVASDIPVFREVGGEAVVYCPASKVEAWVDTVCRLLSDARRAPSRALRLAHARSYSWATHARIIGNEYRRLAGLEVA
jgi:glycosyltransferase involved in cell wall biosynthesis